MLLREGRINFERLRSPGWKGTLLSFFRILLAAGFATSLAAQEPIEKVLLPVVIEGEVPGAHGSRWVSNIALSNSADIPIHIAGYDPGCPLAPCVGPYYLPGGLTIYPDVPTHFSIPAAFLHVPTQHVEDIKIQLLVRDLSRELQTLGTEIPVVRESDASSRVSLIDIPVAERFRNTLRIYDFAPREGASVTAMIYGLDPSIRYPASGQPPPPDVLLGAVQLELRYESAPSPNQPPGYLEIASPESLVDTQGYSRLRIDIVGDNESPRQLWAFVSVTNNETQHVTTITP